MSNGLEIKSKQIDSMKTKRNMWNFGFVKKLKDYDDDIEGYLDTNSDSECRSVFEGIKAMHSKLEEKAYDFNPLYFAIYVEQLIGDIIGLYAKAFKLMLENLKRKPKYKEYEEERKSREQDSSIGKEFSKMRTKEHDWDSPEIDMSNWAEMSSSKLKASNGKEFSGNLMAMPASDPLLFYRSSTPPAMTFESPSFESEMAMEL